MIRFFIGFFAIIFLIFSSFTTKVEINDDISKYRDFIGINAKEEYQNKWDMDESIFPKDITSSMKIVDYKMVYYNPWDAQYLSYLIIDYNKKDYEKEVNRLKGYTSTDYIGYYGVTGFTKYTLLAIYADKYQGFVYALTDNENRVIYVELIFCNYFYDLEYEKYINDDFLPDGFDATLDNEYQNKMLK